MQQEHPWWYWPAYLGRWLVFIPAGFAALLVAEQIIAFIGVREGALSFVIKIVAPGIGTFIGIWAGAYTAPSKRKFVPAMVVTCVVCLVVFIGILMRIAQHEWMAVVGLTAGLIGAIGGAVSIGNDEGRGRA